MEWINEWQAILVYVVGLILVLIFARWHSSNDPTFDFRQALVDPDTKRISFSRLGHFVALVISTTIISYETVNGRLSEWLFMGYMVTWAGTYVAAKAFPGKVDERSRHDSEDSECHRNRGIDV